jgi:hypothetical protein
MSYPGARPQLTGLPLAAVDTASFSLEPTMPSLHDLLPARFELPNAHRLLMVFATIVAVALLSFYVHLLHESMALGDQMRERQRSAISPGHTKVVSQRLPARVEPARESADSGAARRH